MNVTIPGSWYFFGGAFAGFTLSLLLTLPLMFWAGFPRRRERELEADLCDAYEEIEHLRKELKNGSAD